ncbi:MAG: hypothetical protein AAB011_10825, partial [Candidatus Eisenbacteria bacterium]
SLGLPGLNGLIGEVLILLGAFKMDPWVAGIAATGVILGAVYLLWMFQRVMFGPVTNEKNRALPDLTRREFWVLAPVIFFIVWIGVYPNTFLRFLDMPSAELIERMSSRSVAERVVEPEMYGGDEAAGADLDTALPGDDAVMDGEAGMPADSAGVEVDIPPPPVGSPGSVTR